MNSHNSYDLLAYNTLAPLLSRVRSQSLQPVRQFTTARSNYATASQCGFCLIIYLKESDSMRINSRQSILLQSLFARGKILRIYFWGTAIKLGFKNQWKRYSTFLNCTIIFIESYARFIESYARDNFCHFHCWKFYKVENEKVITFSKTSTIREFSNNFKIKPLRNNFKIVNILGDVM